eukprot:COSAG01_NODE_4188_length_5258_cov_53.863927_3_plen_106_part_00
MSCYPGEGASYVQHVDNPNRNGRVLTAIYYLNPGWEPADGGVLRLFTEAGDAKAQVEPLADRLLLFFSDKRCPHLVEPAWQHRYAVTCWFTNARVTALQNTETAS